MFEALVFLNTVTGGWLTYIGLALIGAVSVYFKGKADGKTVEKERAAEAETEAKNVSNEIDRKVASQDAETNRKRLGKWGR
ncbi:hypothetical protein ABE527_20295 [Brucella sp. TWI432]